MDQNSQNVVLINSRTAWLTFLCFNLVNPPCEYHKDRHYKNYGICKEAVIKHSLGRVESGGSWGKKNKTKEEKIAMKINVTE